jgi:leader peptidase (prepilin peptidase)/N-methyltransferase
VLCVAVLAFATLSFDRALVDAIAAGVLVVLSAIDLERHIIPNRIVLPAAAIVLVLNIALFPGRAGEWAVAAVIAAVVFAAPALFGRNWVGMGDAKLMLLLGATLGWAVVGAVFCALVLTFPASAWLIVRRGTQARKAMIPFGPFLALGAAVVMFGPTLAGLSG